MAFPLSADTTTRFLLFFMFLRAWSSFFGILDFGGLVCFKITADSARISSAVEEGRERRAGSRRAMISGTGMVLGVTAKFGPLLRAETVVGLRGSEERLMTTLDLSKQGLEAGV